MSKKLIASAIFAVAFVATSVSAADLGTTTLKFGMKSTFVSNLQTALGVTPVTGYFGSITKAKVMAFQKDHGLTADGFVGAMTKAAINATTSTTTTGTTTTSTTLKGGAGDITVTHYGTGEKSSVYEGDSDKLALGFKVEADGSDVSLTSVKLAIENTNTASSYKISKYVDSVDLYKGSTKIGSADASDFSKDSDDIYTKSISVSNAVIKDGDKDAFSVKVNMIDDVDTANLSAVLKFSLNSVRFQDAEGVVSTESNFTVNSSVDVDDASKNDGADVASSTNNPKDATVSVDDENTTDKQLAMAFKFDVEEDSSDITVTSIPVLLTFASNGTTDDSFADKVIDAVKISIGGEEFDADLTTDSTSNGAGTALYTFDLEDEDLVLEGDDNTEAKVYLSFNGQDGNYANSTTVKASLAKADIDAETSNDDTFTFGGSDRSGALLTLQTNAVAVKFTSALWSTSFTSDTATDIYTATFKFDVTAPKDQDIYLPLDGFAFGTTGGQGIELKDNGEAGTFSSVTISSGADEGNYGFLVAAGETESFTVAADVAGDAASHKVSVSSVWYETTDSTPNGDSEITSGLTDFKTASKTLYK